MLSLGLTCCVILQNYDIGKKMEKAFQETRCETLSLCARESVSVRESQCAANTSERTRQSTHR